VLGEELAALAHVVVALFLADAGEAERRLATAAVLLRERDHDALQDFLVVALERGVEDAVSVDDHEAELLVVLEQRLQRLGVELVLALVAEDVDGLEGLQVQGDLLFALAVVQRNDAAEKHEAVRGDAPVELQLYTVRRGDLLSLVEVMAESTDWRVWRDLICVAPDSSWVSN
jgi:hypothetical protein